MRISGDTGWYEIPTTTFGNLVAEARIAHLEEQLAQARAEIELLEQERDMALYELAAERERG